MARKKSDPEAIQTGIQLPDGGVIVWQANRPLSEEEHEQLSNKLRFEQAQSGINIMLLPYTVKAAVADTGNTPPESTKERE